MFVTCASPKGAVCRLNLDQLPIWRLELAAVGADLGIGLRYVAAGTTAVVLLAAIDTTLTTGENQSIARVGLPRWGKAGNLERMQESMKILFNSELKPAAVDEMIRDSVELVDIYHSTRDALTMGGEASGFFKEWRWIIHREPVVTTWPMPKKKEATKEEAVA